MKKEKQRVFFCGKYRVVAGTVAEAHGAAGTQYLHTLYQISSGTVENGSADFDLCRSV